MPENIDNTPICAESLIKQCPIIKNPFQNESERLVANYVINNKLHQKETNALLDLIHSIDLSEVSLTSQKQIFKIIDQIKEPEVNHCVT